MNRTRDLVMVGLIALALAGCGGGSSGSGSTATSTATGGVVTYFGGLKSIATAGGASVRLAWDGASGGSFSYQVYASATSGGQDFGAPIASTASTSIVLTSAQSALIAESTRVFFVVRATDAGGTQDTNQVELACTPVPAGQVAFVSDTAGGAGTIGDPTDPFPTIQDGITAVETAGAGVVLIDGDASGTIYTQELTISTPVASIGIFGGFPRFSTLPANPTGAQILATRDVAGNETALSGGLVTLTDNDLVTLSNSLSPTDIDGLTVRDLYVAGTPLTGTLTFTEGSHRVTGVGTDFVTEVTTGNVIIGDDEGIAMDVEAIRSANELILETPWPAASGDSTGYVRNGAIQNFIIGTDVNLQISCCRLLSGTVMDLDSSLPTVAMTLRLVGNDIIDEGDRLANFDGGIQHMRIQNNEIRFRDNDIAFGTVAVPASSSVGLYFTHNRLTDADGLVDLAFTASDPTNGSDLMALIEENDTRYGGDDIIDLDDMSEIGANGSVSVIARNNRIFGTSGSAFTFDTLDSSTDPFAGVSCTIEMNNNTIFSCDDYAMEVELGAAAGQTASITANDNFFGPMEDELLYTFDRYISTADVHDQGTLRVAMHRNVGTGGSSALLDLTYGPSQGGDVFLDMWENTFRHPDDYGVEIDLDNVQGQTTATYTYPDAGRCFVTLFNNDIHGGGDDEAMQLEDGRGTGTETTAFWWIGHSYAQADGDASDGAFVMDQNSRYAHWMFERNVGLGSGQDDNEVGFHWDHGSTNIPSTCTLRNNTATGGFGGGFQQETDGGWMQLVNNTAAYSGSEDDNHGAFSFDQTGRDRGDTQMFLMNCVASHSGGQDMDYEDGMISLYSLVQDALGEPAGFMNIVAEPQYAKSFTDLAFPLSVGQFSDLYTLLSTSPAVNAGHPAARYNDTDGSRNDMGAYGGPGGGPVGVMSAGTALPLAFVGLTPHADLYSGAPLMDATQTLYLVFNQAVDVSTLAGNLTVTNGGVAVPGATASLLDGRIITFTPTTVLNPTSGSIVEVAMSTGILGTNGAALNRPNLLRFGVAGTPTAEVEANDDGVAGVTAADMAAAQAIALPGGATTFEVAGALGAADDVDVYAITLNAGERLMATVLNNRLVTGTTDQLDIGIHDDQGRRIRMGRRRTFDGGVGSGDPYVDWVATATGTYYVVVNMGSGAGTPAYTLQAVVDPLD